jgi:DNA topoisomerase-1
LGPHPDGGTVALYQGRYGPYVSHNGTFASLPKSADPATLSAEEAIRLLAERQGTRRPRRRAAGKAAPAKAATAAKAPKAAAGKPARPATRRAAAAKKPAARPKSRAPARGRSRDK